MEGKIFWYWKLIITAEADICHIKADRIVFLLINPGARTTL
jgi:hypothetical protein